MAYPTKKVGNDQDILAQLERFVDRVGCPARPAEEPRLRGDRRKAERASWSIRLDGKMTLRQFGKLQKRPIRFSERTRRLPNEAPRTRWEAIMAGSVDTHDQQSQPIPAKKLVKVFLPAKFARERHSRSRRSPVRSAAKSGGDDGGGDGDSDQGEPPRPSHKGRIILPAPIQARLIPFSCKANSFPHSRIVHPCRWSLDWRWVA
jgi:hypothetical protein